MSVRWAESAGRRLASVALVALSCGWPLASRARDQLEIPEPCGTASELEREVTALEQGSAAERPRPDVHMRREDTSFVLEVALPEGARTLRDSDCRALFRAAILIAALRGAPPAPPPVAPAQADPEVRSAPEPTSAKLSAPNGPQASKQVQAGQADELSQPALREPQQRRDARAIELAPRRPRGPIEAHALVTAGATYGIVPKVAAAVGAGIELARGRWATQLGLSYLSPSSTELDDGSGVRVQGYAASANVELALVHWLRAAVGAELYVLQGRGQGSGTLRQRTDFSTLPAAHAGLSARLFGRGRFRLLLPIHALFAPTPARFVLTGRGAVYTTSSFGFQGGLSASYQFH